MLHNFTMEPENDYPKKYCVCRQKYTRETDSNGGKWTLECENSGGNSIANCVNGKWVWLAAGWNLPTTIWCDGQVKRLFFNFMEDFIWWNEKGLQTRIIVREEKLRCSLLQISKRLHSARGFIPFYLYTSRQNHVSVLGEKRRRKKKTTQRENQHFTRTVNF